MDNDYEFKLGDDWYTGSVTSFKGVQKLTPNCVLDLIDGTFKRFWPNKNWDKKASLNTEEILNRIVFLLRGMMTGAVAQGQVLCSITGGHDSRVVLAASKQHWAKMRFFTLRSNSIKKDDISYASKLVDISGINHTFYNVTDTPKWLDDLYDEIGQGESIGSRREIIGTCLQLEGKDIIHANGNLGAICKSYYWPQSYPSQFKISAVTRDFITQSNTIIDGVEEWFTTTKGIDNTSLLYNLFYLEQRGGRWAAVGENCSRLFYESFSPFNHRELFLAINSLPMELQYGGKLLTTFVERMAPELMEVPYCKAQRNWSKYLPETLKKKLRVVFQK